MLDLFGDPIAELPTLRPRSSSRFGSPKHAVPQTSASQPTPPAINDTEPLDEEAELHQVLADLSMHGLVGRYLQDRELPCVDVFEVKEQYFANARLELFDFVVSAPEGHNWLLYAAPLSTAARDDLRQWEQVFGPGFYALAAEKIDSDDDDTFTLTFRTLDGEKVVLE